MSGKTQHTDGMSVSPVSAYRSLIMTSSLLFIAVSIALIVAWSLELLLHLAPCELCLIERIPYYIALPVLVTIGWGAKQRWQMRFLYFSLALVSCILLTTLMVSAYHSGVEWQFWSGPASCTDAGVAVFKTSADLSEQLKSTQLVRCDEPPFLLFGLSPAGWNTLLSAVLIFIALREVIRGMSKKISTKPLLYAQ